MRKFNVTVNGKSYNVEVEEIGAAATASAPAAAPVAVRQPHAATCGWAPAQPLRESGRGERGAWGGRGVGRAHKES